ncbi:MAG: glucan biosynthesis protein G [Alphaproteobacteria bacterium]|nr:glucan biosynthesis protein G [Alphaproteobacteria bacterium]
MLGARRGFALERAASGHPFSRQTVIDEAKRTAAAPFRLPPKVPHGLRKLNYDSYRQIRFRKDKAVWGETPALFSTELFAPGFLYETGIDMFVVENGQSHAIAIQADSFETPTPEIAALLAEVGQFAGFRLHYPINREDYRDEFVVFQGASYFRAVSKGQNYGLSARGLAIDVAESTGEEFPVFRRFWIERPSSRAKSIVVHAVLDSPRVAGAYRFGIYPGTPTTVDVQATLFARAPLAHVGLGTLTSMFMHSSIDGPEQPDYRSAVHDSLGLSIHTGHGERVWRPLSNPVALQISAFVDRSPKGFGLIQRSRRFEDFQDLEAVYEKRPSAWVAPRGDWGDGHIQLVEIPSASETNDNIVTYWRPKQPIEPGQPYYFSYRLTWPDKTPQVNGIAPVVRSAYGRRFDGAHHQLSIDYANPGISDAEALTLDASLSAGRIIEKLIQPNPATRGHRVFLTFDPGDASLIEFRLQPQREGTPAGETWLYRWIRR